MLFLPSFPFFSSTTKHAHATMSRDRFSPILQNVVVKRPTDHPRCSPFTAEIYAKRERERAKQAGKSQ